MGRKSSAKAQTKPASTGGPSGGSPLKFAAIGGVALAVVVAIYAFSSRTAPQEAQAPAAPAVAMVPDSALRGPHPQADLPPLPFIPEPPARSPDARAGGCESAVSHGSCYQ